MHRAARIFGLAWIAAIAVAGSILWAHNASLLARGLYGAYGLLVILFASALPGVLLVRWGRGPTVCPPTVRELLRPKAPYDRAAEAGHSMTIETDSPDSLPSPQQISPLTNESPDRNEIRSYRFFCCLGLRRAQRDGIRQLQTGPQ